MSNQPAPAVSSATPGPWRATKIGASVKAGQETIAIIPEGPNRKADADLIASVYDLRNACQAVLNLAFKHETQYWLDAPGTDAEKLEKIVSIMRDAFNP